MILEQNSGHELLRRDLLTELGVDERVVLHGRKCPRSQSLLALSCNHSNEGTLMALVIKESVVVMITQVTTWTIAERATFVTKVCNVSNQISYKRTYVFTHSAPLFLPSIRKTDMCQELVKIPNINFHSDPFGRNLKLFTRTGGRTGGHDKGNSHYSQLLCEHA